MSTIIFHCPECTRRVAVATNGLGFDLACPHCGNTVPVPWENLSSEAQGQANPAESPAAPPRVYHDSSRVDKLANTLLELCSYEALGEWTRDAKQEQDKISEALERSNDGAETSRLTRISGQLRKLVEIAAFAPKSPAEKNLLLKKLRQEKKEIVAKKRETTMAMAAIRQEARQLSAGAGKTGLLGPNALIQIGQGDFYDSSLAAR